MCTPEAPLPTPKGSENNSPPPVSNQEVLTQKIEQALKESDVMYEQTQGENFLGA